MLSFGKMHVEGFGPIMDQTFYWDKQGLNLIKGPNGNGKTKFINALVWVLYGKTLTGSVTTWESIKPKKYKGTKVTLWFKVNNTEYKVTRCKGYTGLIDGAKGKNQLFLEEDGKPIKADGKNGMKEELSDIIGYSFDLFKNSIIFGQKLKRIVSETGPNKKKILDEAFDVMYISKAAELADKELKIIQPKLSKAENIVNLINSKIESLTGEIGREKTKIENFEADKSREIEEELVELRGIKKKYRTLKVEIPNTTETENSLGKLRIKLADGQRELEVYNAVSNKLVGKRKDLEYKNKDLYRLNESVKKAEASCESIIENCHHCGKPYTAKEKAKEKADRKIILNKLVQEQLELQLTIKNIEKDIIELEKQVTSAKNLTENINSITKEVKVLEEVIKKKSETLKVLDNLKEKIKDKRSNIKRIKGRTLQKNYDQLTNALKEQEAQLEIETQQLLKLEEERDDYQWVIKDPLSNSGLKAFIFDSLLDQVNDRLDYYTKFSGMSVGFLIDMSSARKDVNIVIANSKGEYIPYDDLSGGQQQKVDIVSVFAVHDVVSNTKDCSLLIMDELFESLDKQNIELLTELIQDKAKEKCLYLVTHRNEFSPTNANEIRINFDDGLTSIDF